MIKFANNKEKLNISLGDESHLLSVCGVVQYAFILLMPAHTSISNMYRCINTQATYVTVREDKVRL